MIGPHLGDELSALLDGELAPDEAAAAQAHLRECAFCTSELAAFDRARSAVRSLPMVDPPGALRPRELERRRGSVWVAVGAAAAVLVALQVVPVDRSVSPAVASLVQAHAVRAVNADPVDVAARSWVVEAHMAVRRGGERAEFDVVPVSSNVRLAGKYTVVTAPGRMVASRDTVEVEVVDKRTGRVVEKAALDRETGVVVWREVYDSAGRVVRTVEAQWLRASAGPAPTPDVRSVGRLIPTPSKLDGDYQRVGVYKRGEVVHQLFSDGLHALSVFAEAGSLDEGGLPGNAASVHLGGHAAHHFDWPGGEVLVWESGGVVYTAVGDAPVDDVKAAAASMPAPRSLGVGERLKRGCRALADAVAGD